MRSRKKPSILRFEASMVNCVRWFSVIHHPGSVESERITSLTCSVQEHIASTSLKLVWHTQVLNLCLPIIACLILFDCSKFIILHFAQSASLKYGIVYNMRILVGFGRGFKLILFSQQAKREKNCLSITVFLPLYLVELIYCSCFFSILCLCFLHWCVSVVLQTLHILSWYRYS